MDVASPASLPQDVYIVSDLHLAAGKLRGELHYERLESFFYDDAFARFVDRILARADERGRGVRLILGGDVFDFLTVTLVPEPAEAERLGLVLTRDQQKTGLGSSPSHARWKLRRILEGHPGFFDAIGRLLARGHDLVIVTGNHDMELYWEDVRDDVVRGLLAAQWRVAPESDLTTAKARITFEPWFHREPGRLYFEHGNQYEASNTFPYNLCPERPMRPKDQEPCLDLPVGTIFARYLYNAVRKRNPYLSNLISLEQYLGALARLNLLEMVGVLLRRLVFFVRALRATRLFESRAQKRCRVVHEERVTAYAKRQGLPREALARIQDRRALRAGMTAYHLAVSILRPIVVKVLKYGFYGALGLFLWFLVFSLIQTTGWLATSPWGKASLTAVLALVTILAAFISVSRLGARLQEVTDVAPADRLDLARLIARETRVRHVVMGHTHVAEIAALDDEGRRFANTGTWTALTGMGDDLWPGNHRFTFVRLEDDDLQLLRWNDQAGRFDPVLSFVDYQLRPSDVLFPEDPMQAPDPGRSSSRLPVAGGLG